MNKKLLQNWHAQQEAIMMSGSFDAPAPSLTAVKWSTVTSHPNFIFTNSDRTAELGSVTGLWLSTKGDISFSTGKHQVFFQAVAWNGSNGLVFGLGNAAASVGIASHGYPGADANSWGWRPLDSGKFPGGIGTGLAGVVGDVFGLLYDADAGEIYINKNSGTPVLIFSGVSGALYPMAASYDVGGKFIIGTSADFGATLESGYSDWEA